MIFYNFRYRGPYEYDKYVLNVFQYSNMVNDFINDINNTATWKTLYDLNNEVFWGIIPHIYGSDGIVKLAVVSEE